MEGKEEAWTVESQEEVHMVGTHYMTLILHMTLNPNCTHILHTLYTDTHTLHKYTHYTHNIHIVHTLYTYTPCTHTHTSKYHDILAPGALGQLKT